MDQIKTGKFIASCRKERGLTQETLGEKLGLSNKTISRWETGVYMPGIDMLEPLGEVLGVSVHELLAGQRLEPENFQKEADEILVSALRDSKFTFQEQMAYWKKKWMEDHWILVTFCAIFWAGLFLVAFWRELSWLVGLCPLAASGFYMYLRNRMMIYVEDKLYGDIGKSK